jgi:hypothetical protein
MPMRSVAFPKHLFSGTMPIGAFLCLRRSSLCSANLRFAGAVLLNPVTMVRLASPKQLKSNPRLFATMPSHLISMPRLRFSGPSHNWVMPVQIASPYCHRITVLCRRKASLFNSSAFRSNPSALPRFDEPSACHCAFMQLPRISADRSAVAILIHSVPMALHVCPVNASADLGGTMLSLRYSAHTSLLTADAIPIADLPYTSVA